MSTLSRREFLRISAAVSASTVAAACVAVTPTAAPAQPAQVPAGLVSTAVPTEAKFHEAPMLADLVAKGSLPAVAERLPLNPDVCPVIESVGKFGGTIRRGFKGVSDRWGPTKFSGNNLTWFTFKLTLRASLAESWELSEDATTWTWHLRKGTRWSDGTPFTSENFSWQWEHYYQNAELQPSPPENLASGSAENKVLAELSTPDDTTVIIKFQQPRPLFGYEVVGHNVPIFAPGDFMQQYHPDFVDKAKLDATAKAAGFDSWVSYYKDRDLWYMNITRPSIYAWIPTNALSEELFIMERNPYFWQVDPEGAQLPYVDKVAHRLFETPEVLNLWIVNGEIDFQGRHVDIGNFTLYKENEEKGGFKMIMGVDASTLCFLPNHACKNLRVREFFQDRNVRLALSYAVNRSEINELVYDGVGTPRQYGALSMSPDAYAPLQNAYLEYDVDKANALLDEAGYKERDADGFRKFKDGSGETLSFIIEGFAVTGEQFMDAILMIINYFKEVGLKCSYYSVERSLYSAHYDANEIESSMTFGFTGYTVFLTVTPYIILGTALDTPWSGGWGWYHEQPESPNAEKPPEGHWIWEIWGIWDKLIAEADEAKRQDYLWQILDIWARELPIVGYLGEFPKPFIVKNGLHNFVAGYPNEDLMKDESVLGSQTLYWDEPEKHV